jgi:hypothetical protein
LCIEIKQLIKLNTPSADEQSKTKQHIHQAAIHSTTPKFSIINLGVSYLTLLGDYSSDPTVRVIMHLLNRSIHVLQTQEMRKCVLCNDYIILRVGTKVVNKLIIKLALTIEAPSNIIA